MVGGSTATGVIDYNIVVTVVILVTAVTVVQVVGGRVVTVVPL